jgi:hypothetical protein
VIQMRIFTPTAQMPVWIMHRPPWALIRNGHV